MLMWYFIRAFGLVAFLLFSVSVALGSSSTTGGRTAGAIDRRMVRQLVHRWTAIGAFAALATHLVLLTLDGYLPVSVTGILLPFTAPYDRLALAIGSIAMYLFLVAIMSGLLRRIAPELTDGPAWRKVHLSAYAGWVLCLVHGLLAGSDSQTTWARVLYATAGLAVVTALVIRLAAPARRRVDGRLNARAGAIR